MLRKLISLLIMVAAATQPAAAAGWTPVPLTGSDSAVCRPEAPERDYCIPWMADNGKPVFSQKLQWDEIESRDLTATEQSERVASLFYLTPPTTMLMDYFIFGTMATLNDMVGLVIVTIGVVLAHQANRYRQKS